MIGKARPTFLSSSQSSFLGRRGAGLEWSWYRSETQSLASEFQESVRQLG